MFMFNMPDEVIWEYSDPHGTFYDDNAEYMGGSDRYESQHIEARPIYVKCKRCGWSSLEWVYTDRGWRLAYTNGKLKGKIHACNVDRKGYYEQR